MKLCEITKWFLVLAPIMILLVDAIVFHVEPDATISNVVGSWHKKSPWMEAIYVVGVVVLYLHLFRNWPR